MTIPMVSSIHSRVLCLFENRETHDPVSAGLFYQGRVKREDGESPSHDGQCCEPDMTQS